MCSVGFASGITESVGAKIAIATASGIAATLIRGKLGHGFISSGLSASSGMAVAKLDENKSTGQVRTRHVKMWMGAIGFPAAAPAGLIIGTAAVICIVDGAPKHLLYLKGYKHPVCLSPRRHDWLQLLIWC